MRVPAETIETCTIFRPAAKFCRQTAPVLGSRNGPQNGGQVVRTQANQIETERVASILGSVSGPQNGGRFVGRILVAGRKIARVSIVSARTRQKFSMPLLFGFAAPQALVLHTLRTFMATHVLELGRPSVAGPVFARVFGPQTGVQKNYFFRSLEGAKSLENL